ncbi:hypothetical protein EBT23_04725 [bacterium]|nr:hypothetical protein [bacterium]
MNKEEKIRQDEVRKVYLGKAPDLGGIALPVSRGGLLKAFWSLSTLFLGWLFWGSRGNINGETFLVTSVLVVLCLIPSWLWCSGRVSGLPIFPSFSLTFLPTYVIPLWKGTRSLASYTSLEINTAGWTLAAFLGVGLLFWHQLCAKNRTTPSQIMMIEQVRSEWILMGCILLQVVFEIGIFFFKEFGEGVFPIIRGLTSSAGRLGLFIFSYQMGKGSLSTGYKGLFIVCLSAILIRQTSSLLLSTAIPTVGIVFSAYILGRGKIPWIPLLATVFTLAVLQLGKVEMREQYFSGEKQMSLLNATGFFSEWVGYGFKNMGVWESKDAKREDIESVQERGSLVQVMLKIQQKTPSQLPYLEGETYRYIPEMLIPRIFNKEKIWVHAGNMILSVYYGFLEQEKIFQTSIAFDPIIEAYANFGYAGVFFIATIMGAIIGITTNLTTRVPMLSFRFLAGVQLMATLLASFNTAGVLVTSLWQSLISLVLLSFVLMKKMPNPLFAKPESVRRLSDGEDGLADHGSGGVRSENDGRSVTKSSIPALAEQGQLRHERPHRYIYKGNKVK